MPSKSGPSMSSSGVLKNLFADKVNLISTGRSIIGTIMGYLLMHIVIPGLAGLLTSVAATNSRDKAFDDSNGRVTTRLPFTGSKLMFALIMIAITGVHGLEDYVDWRR